MEGHTSSEDKSGPGKLDLTPVYAVIRFSGSEALEFLQRQLSNDIMLLGPEIAQVNAYLTPKGRVIALLTMILHEDGALALVDRQMVALISQALQRYVIRSDVQILAPDPHWQIHGCAGPADRESDLQLDALNLTRDGATLAIQWPGARQIILSRSATEQSYSHESRPLSLQGWQQLDIEHLLARIGPAESEQFVPQMLSLDTLKVVNFKKGCYPGQEVVARTHYRGRIKRSLVKYSSDTELEPGTTLSVQEGDTLKPVGRTLQGVTTANRSWLGLAVIHESGVAAQQLVSEADPSIRVCITPVRQ